MYDKKKRFLSALHLPLTWAALVALLDTPNGDDDDDEKVDLTWPKNACVRVYRRESISFILFIVLNEYFNI